MSNLDLYNRVRTVPQEAQKTIGAGRLKGMTDINPMWRIKTLTEEFGTCGVGWYYEVVDKWTETVADEVTANVTINLYIRSGDGWSMPIVGIGGSKLASKEKAGIYVSDECYKMALTDAISVACKALGMGADVYWSKDNTKYSTNTAQTAQPVARTLTNREKVIVLARERGIPFAELMNDYKIDRSTTEERFSEILKDLEGN